MQGNATQGTARHVYHLTYLLEPAAVELHDLRLVLGLLLLHTLPQLRQGSGFVWLMYTVTMTNMLIHSSVVHTHEDGVYVHPSLPPRTTMKHATHRCRDSLPACSRACATARSISPRTSPSASALWVV